MVIRGYLSSSGIALNEDQLNNIGSCCYARRTKIPYADILAVEERQAHHFLIKYVDRSTRPCQLKKRTVYISSHRASESASSSRNSLMSLETDGSCPVNGRNIEEIVMKRAYAACPLPTQRQAVLVILNPHSGPGDALKHFYARVAPIFQAAGLKTNVIKTKYSGHAVELARTISLDEVDTIVCVSGDGLPHEVLNGLASRDDGTQALQKVGIAQLPGGSGNAMSLSLHNGERDWAAITLEIIKGVPEPVDIMAITQDQNLFFSFLSQSYGVVADCDLGTEHLRWMGGARFAVGLVYKCLARNNYPCEIAYKEVDTLSSPAVNNDESRRNTGGTIQGLEAEEPTSSTNSHMNKQQTLVRQGSVEAPSPPLTESSTAQPSNTQNPYPLRQNLTLSVTDPLPADWTVENHHDLSMFYVGKMEWMSADARVFPRVDPLDGAMDMIVWDNNFGSINALSAFTKFEKGTHVDQIPFYKKVKSYRLTPLTTHQHLSIDGEAYPCSAFQVEVLWGAAKFIVPSV